MCAVRTERELDQRRAPRQQRSRERMEAILDTTSALLAEFGVDRLTTVMIADEIGISVGSLYHYFPNKHAILYALARRWLDGLEQTFASIGEAPIESLSIDEFTDAAIDALAACYRRERAMLPLAQALWTIPELRPLDHRHDSLVIDAMSCLLKRLEFRASENELNRISRAWLEVSHALLLVTVSQRKRRRSRTLDDLKRLCAALLSAHRGDTLAATRDIEAP